MSSGAAASWSLVPANPPELLPSVRDFQPENCQLHLVPAATSAASTAEGNALRSYKALCDVLLPALRARAHLFNLIHRHKHNCSLVLTRDGVALGGATFRIFVEKRVQKGPAAATGGRTVRTMIARQPTPCELLTSGLHLRPTVCHFLTCTCAFTHV